MDNWRGRETGAVYEPQSDNIGGLGNHPDLAGSCGAFRWCLVADPADSSGCAGLVQRRAIVASWPKLTVGVRIGGMGIIVMGAAAFEKRGPAAGKWL